MTTRPEFCFCGFVLRKTNDFYHHDRGLFLVALMIALDTWNSVPNRYLGRRQRRIREQESLRDIVECGARRAAGGRVGEQHALRGLARMPRLVAWVENNQDVKNIGWLRTKKFFPHVT